MTSRTTATGTRSSIQLRGLLRLNGFDMGRNYKRTLEREPYAILNLPSQTLQKSFSSALVPALATIHCPGTIVTYEGVLRHEDCREVGRATVRRPFGCHQCSAWPFAGIGAGTDCRGS